MIQQAHFWVYTQKIWNQDLIFSYTHVHSNIIYKKLKPGCVQVSINRSMNKQNVVFIYNGTLLSLKKEGNSDIC